MPRLASVRVRFGRRCSCIRAIVRLPTGPRGEVLGALLHRAEHDPAAHPPNTAMFGCHSLPFIVPIEKTQHDRPPNPLRPGQIEPPYRRPAADIDREAAG